MEWVVWSFLLLLQNAAFTWVSRARNSSSVKYHGIAAVVSNGVFILNQFIVVNKLVDAKKTGNIRFLTFVVVFYILWTTIGSLTMHWFLLHKIERGKLRPSVI